jgi:hypothetical protein
MEGCDYQSIVQTTDKVHPAGRSYPIELSVIFARATNLLLDVDVTVRH